MRTTLRCALALATYVSCLATGPVVAQVGPIQPVLTTSKESSQVQKQLKDLAEDYSIPVDIFVGRDGTVTNVVITQTSKNPAADLAAFAVVGEKRFLPGLDAAGAPVEGLVKANVNMFSRGGKKVVKITLKPPPASAEIERVQKLTCRDFLWEVKRMDDEARVENLSYEVMPFTSARMYMQKKNVPYESEDKFWDLWPGALKTVVNRCEKAEEKMYFTEVLVPSLDGELPSSMTASASPN